MNIGAAARNSGCHVETIRYYERVGLLAASRRSAAGYRVYSEADVDHLRFIHRARGLGFSLDEIRELLSLSERADQPCREVDDLATKHLLEVRARQQELARMAEALEGLIASCAGPTADCCTIIGALRGGAPLPKRSGDASCPGL
jgi:MerR family mercuric resistance operon transcriptional regulator